MFSFGIKRTQMRLRLKTTQVVVAVLLGSLLVPVAGITTPQSLPTANAAVSNGSISVPNSGALRINWAQNLSLLGVTFETYVNFTTIAGRNGIFASCYEASPSVNGDGTACQAWGQALRLTWSNSGAFQLAVNDYNGDPGCTINSSAPATNTWYHIALSVPTAANFVNVPSLLFVDGKEVGRCNFVMRTEQVGIRSVALGGDGNSAGVSKMNFGPTRISNFQRYTSEFSPLQIFPTTGDSYAWAVLNTPFDPDNSVSCQTVSDQNNRGVAVSTFSHLDLFWANSSAKTGGGTGKANLECSNSAPPVPVPFFTYANSTIVATRGVAITPRIASSTGGTIDSYAVQPLLPTGLLLNSTTGEISGTPTAPSQTATYVVTATQNGTGATKTVNVTITVSNPVTTLVINDLVNAAQVGRVETLTATATPVAGAVAFSTDQGPIPGCESVPTSTSAPFVAQCPWNPTSAYYILSASFTATDSANYTSSTAPSKTNVRGSLSLTSTGTTTYPSVGQSLNTNNTLRLNFPSGTGLITAQSFTIETWVKVNSSVLNMDISAFYGNSFYGDRGQGISITNSDSRIYNFLDASAVGLVTPTVPIAANNSWQNIVYQRKYVQGSASQSYDAVFVNGVLVTQFANGGYMVAYDPSSTNKSSGVRIGPFNGDVQIGPTQVLSGVAAYPLSGFSPSTTYAFGSNTLALFQPSPTACTSAAVSPLSVTATHGASTSQCSGGPGGFPVALPYVTSVDANRGPLAGANVVTVSGSNFLDVPGVKFGTLSATNVTVNAYGTQLTATVPAPVSLGDVSVTVTTAAGTSPPVSGSTYTYLPLPTITNLNPTVGDAVGNNSVVITGTGFTNASAVLFGSKPATSFTVNSSSRITAISPPGTGTVGVQVTAPGGTTVASNFTYSAATSVNSITPNSGSTGGNTTVEITGTNFTAATAVKFDTQNASSFTVVNSTKIIAVSPAGSAATVGVTVVVGGIDYTLSSAYTYTATVEVTAISVASGPTTGGTEVQISGTNFTSASTVVFGTTAATNVSYDSGTGKLTATSPAGTGTVNVRVTTGAAPQSATATANQFIYYAPPTITGLSRSTGPNGGGSSVIITGTNFTSASTVAFGSNNVSTFTINSTTQITATSPTGTGAVDVRVSNQGGTSENVDADNFTYFPVPVVTSISPSTGTTAGGTSVTITGENFTSATGVKFGTADGTSVTVVSATQITVVAPAGTGEVNVSVITPGGTSAIALYGKFTYVSVPTITSISPSSGMLTGGQEVIIDGTGLDNLLITGGVLFGSIAAQSVTVNSSTQIRVITPATSTLGDIDIFVVNASGSSVASSASKFTYTKSNDAKLSALILTQATLVGGFSPTTDSYTSSVVNSVDKVTVTPTVNQANATVQVKIGSGDFATVVSGSASADLPLVVGANTISVKVTAHDERTVITYTITLTRLSNVATLSAASIKGQSATVGTAGTALGSLVAGSITLTTAQATGTGATTFTKTDAGATITKIAKLASGTEENLTNFDAATALTNSATTTVTNYDFFIVKITAADGTVNYSRFNVTVNSDVASLSGATIKGQTPTLGTPNATLGSETPGAITLTTAQATGVDTTTFTKTDAGATISKIVKYATGASTTNFESDTAFTNGAASTVTTGDFFIVKVTSADATVRFYRVNVTVNSNVATLSASTVIKGLAPSSYGTSSATLGSETPGAITLTTALATGVAATTFTKTDAGATITKIVKYATGATTTNFETDAAFSNGSTGTVINGDFFIVKVTAADATVNYSRFNVTVNSDVATLSGATIKGQTPNLGTPNAVLASVVAGTITLTTAQATGTDTTTFTKTDSNAVISRIVKYSTGAVTTGFESDAAFTNGATATVTSGDFFIVKVTAADATVRFYRINVTVNSNVATLSGATIKGLTGTVGTAGTSLGSLTAGSVILSVSQATGNAATTFTITDAGATITKIAKLASGTTENLTNFNAAAAFTNGSTGTVSNGDFFIIQVTAADGTVNYSRVNSVFATNPTVPLSLSATAQAGGANLSWSAPTSNGGSALTGYVIQASTDSTTWTEVGTTNVSTRQLSVTSLLNGTAYVYRVRATNSSGDLNYNWATSASVRSFYLVECSTSGSFYVNSTLSVVQIPSAAGINCMGEVTIPQGIVQINSNAFTVNTETTNRNITKVTFPSTGLRTIDQGAFKNLGLTSVSIPGTVETVGIYSFMNNYITTVFVTGTGPANHPTALLDSAFKGNPISPGIALTLGSGKIQIGENFGTGTVFSSVDWGTGITSVGRRAFYNVAAGSWAPLFPRTITQFDAQAFEGTGIKTIRFGTATTHSVTSINTTAFDPSINSIQYCGSTGTVLSNYINSRFTSKTIWCAEVVPNAPTGVTAAAGGSGQMVLNWSKGASLNEAPTDGFEIRYSSNGGSTWSELIQAAATATSAIVPNLSNGTAYVFQIRAKNLFGNSAYSADASGTPLGAQTNPTFGPTTSTADGFTVNLTNYDATYTYGVPQITVGSGNISVGTATGSNLPITVTGMTPGSVATFSIGNQKTGFSSGTGLASGSALNAAKVPVVGSIVTLTGGFTASVTNYDSAYQWNVSSTVGTAVINTQGGITVSGVNPSTAVELTVSTTRVGYAPGSSKTTVTTLALLKVFYNGTRSTGGAAPTDANSYASNASAVVLANPASGGLTLNGYYLAGWSLNSDETGQVYQPGASLALGLVDVTLYAKWTLTPYTVSYNANGSTGGSVPVDSNTYTMDGSVPVLGNTGTLVRTGYSFIGWGLSSTDTVNQYVSGNTYTVGTSNIAFWARWSPNTYKVTFDANGGTGSPSKAEDNYTTAGTAVPLATRGTLEKSGYNFAGWGLSAVSTLVADPFTTTSNVELYAQWTVANFAITYVAGTYGSGTVPTQANVNFGTSFTVAAANGLTGSDGPDPFAFVSWSDGTRTYAPGESILMGAGAVTLTAQWTRIYNVRYSFNGGSVGTPIADQQKTAGQKIVVSAVVPERPGYEFASWKDQSGEVAIAGADYEVRANHYLLYAQWTAKPYTITYDVNGGNSTIPTQANRTIGQIFTVAAAPTKIGYDFEHWRDGTNNYNPGADYQVATDNVVLQAIWTPQVYQISYNFNGGSGTPIAAQNYTFGSGPASLPASGPTRFEYNFTGWATTNTATAPVASSFAPSGNILLHAVWVTSVYRLTFNAGSGISDTSTATVTIGQSVSLPNATRANYTLQGWSTTETGGTLISLSGPYTPTADAILYAQWVPAVFTVTYNGNSGTAGRATDSINYNSQTPIVLPSASRTNYVFNGWYSQASGGYLLGEAGANFLPTGSVTAYARWVQGSLSGMGPSTLIAQITVRDGIDTGFTAGSNGSTATVSYTAGALPDGTVITAYLENSTTRVTSLLQTPATPILSLILAWVAPDGTVPDTVAGKPILMTVRNSSITAGSKVYGLVGNQPELLGIALVDGQVQVSISKDPVVVVAMVAPDAPTGVTATPIDSTSATILWTAPANNGGTAITKYVATAGAGKSCETLSATTCVIDGLVTGTPYTFTVTASNVIGNSAASAPSSPLTLGAPSSGNTGGGSSGGSSGGAPAPSLPVSDVSTPATEAKAAAEKAAADAKAAAELKAAADKAAAEAAAAAALKAAQEIADAEARAAAELKAAQDKAAEDARIAAELKAAQDKADAELKAAAEKKALDDAKAAAALAAKKIVPKITLYSISSKLTLSAYDNAYLKKYISTLKPKAPVTCIGYYYTKNTTVAKAKALASTQAKAICSMIKKAKPSVITAIALYPSTKAPLAAKGAKWVAVSYRVDSFNKK
jgi:uncharacterized repeat protein (TIGR02543 family)